MRLGNPGLAVDSRLEADGKWVDCPNTWWHDADTPMRVLLRGSGSKEHKALIRRLTRGLTPTQIEEKDEEILAEITSDLIRGWENFFDTEGGQVRYSPEVCRSIVSNPDNRRFVDFITRMARDLSTFNADSGESEKN